MRRTNIYLEDRQLDLLRRLSDRRDESVAALVRHALDDWLERQGVVAIEPDEWERRFDELLVRRDRIAGQEDFTEAEVTSDVLEAVREVRDRPAS
ncbi:ribbon-helix-helix protein, CopG family [Euzebya tangerina]|uniref:ribbon-helix-helix protein, CopG family n=1 Tax=Euzebya tangerina TaxID=591198 RepID=UPI0013C2E7F9|nr:ribbon-helix-helix protein, CopG family [Euzebya tangerina]